MQRLASLALLALCAAGGEAPPVPGPAQPEAAFPHISGLAALRGDLRALPDGRLEAYYDWSDPAQLADWRPEAGPQPQVADGELRLGGEDSHTIRYAVPFVGPVEAAATWRIHEELAPQGHLGIALCAAPWQGYWLYVRERGQELYREGVPPAFLASSDARLRGGTAHTLHFARAGNLLRAWLDEAASLRATDATHHRGSLLLRAWRVRAGLNGVWLMGRPEPAWLAANPGVAGQLDALRLYQGGVGLLGPLWEKGQHAAALARAKALAAEEPLAKSPPAAKWLVEDAAAIAEFWAAAEAGLAKLKPGDPLRIGGEDTAFQKYEGGILTVRLGEADLPRRPAALQGEELAAVAARARPPDARRDLFALALLRLHGGPADPAAVLAALAAAQKAGADVSRHRGLAIPRPPTAARLAPPQPATGEKAIFAGKPLFLEAEAAPVREGAMQVERHEAASGGRFVHEPREPGTPQYGKPTSRVAFHVFVAQPTAAYLWARVLAPSSEANSFFFGVAPEGVDSPALRPWHLAPRPGWHWEPYNASSGVDVGSIRPSELLLQPGINSIVIGVRERGTGLDRLYLSPSPEPPGE